MPHGPFRHRRRPPVDRQNGQDVPNELSRLFGLDTSTDPAQPTPNTAPTATVDSPVVVTPATTSTPVAPTSQAQLCTYLFAPNTFN